MILKCRLKLQNCLVQFFALNTLFSLPENMSFLSTGRVGELVSGHSWWWEGRIYQTNLWFMYTEV